jgi:hypothetical protein
VEAYGMTKRVLMTLVVGLVVGACGGVVMEEPAEGASLEQVGQEVRCGFCGDGVCCAQMESSANPADCGPSYCGDGVCNTPNEDSNSCPNDCGPVVVCGDGICNGGETSTTCNIDCPGPICGDGVCSAGEGNQSCPADCPCGMGKCW